MWTMGLVQLTRHVVAPAILLNVGAASLSRAFFGRTCDGSQRLLFFVTLFVPTLSVIILLTCLSFMPRLLMANALLESAGRTRKDWVTRGMDLT